MKKVITLLLVLAMALSLCACGGGQSSPKSGMASYGMYIKDSELFFTDLKKEPSQISSRLIDNEDIDDADLANSSAQLALYTQVSADGTLVVFPDKVADGINLYYRKTNDAESDATKIDSDVLLYAMNTAATTITYMKGTGEDCNLYQYSIKEQEKEKIASSVREYHVTEDGEKILYVTTEGMLYTVSAGQEKEKIASDITQLAWYSDDFSLVYYIKDEALYKQKLGEDREKIDSDISKVIQVFDSGEAYYLKQETESDTLMNYIDDDMKEVDAEAPTKYPSQPRYRYYNSDEEYQKAYAEYEEALAAYLGKSLRDEWREQAEWMRLSQTVRSLYYYNGTEKQLITDSLAANVGVTAAAESAVISYVAYNQKDVGKTKLSKLAESSDISEFSEKVEKALFSSSDRYITLGGTATVLEQENAKSFCINDAGTVVYYVDDIPEGKNTGDLYTVLITDNTVGEATLYDSDVNVNNYTFLSDTNFLYFKDYKDGSGDLYLNKTKIDYDVYGASVRYNSKLDTIYYAIDWNSEKNYGVLKQYANGEAVKIADDVYDYAFTPDGQVLYLYDYSMKYDSGELYLWNKGESTKIDDDVICLIPAIENREDVVNSLFRESYSYESAAAVVAPY